MTADFRRAVFVTSAAGAKDFRSDRPAVLFVGRSNAGKSTLINLLTGQKSLMKTSATPGKTRLVNYALIDERFYLCDCPGYGFESQRDYFERLMDDFFQVSARTLKGVVLVVDARRGILSSDADMIAFATGHSVPVLAVLTKVDKLNRSQLSQLVQAVKRDYPTIGIVTSSTAKPELIDTVRNEVSKLALGK